MYARIASFAGDMTQVDDLVARIRERMGGGATVPGLTRFLMLLDREGGTSLGITFFESEEAIQAAEPAFERMASETPEAERGRRTSLEVYEVELDEVADGARAARVSSLEGASGEAIDEGVRFVKEQIAPERGTSPAGGESSSSPIARTAGRRRSRSGTGPSRFVRATSAPTSSARRRRRR